MRIRIVLVIAAAMVAAGCTPTPSPDTTTSVPSLAGTVDAPEFPVGLDWINTAEPLTLNDLRGKVVVLDFWTYGCINCIHVIPDFQRLETEFADELVVIGVHSAKFTNEAETANLVDIVQRYGIEHPVVNDRDFAIWDAWGANAWPTAAVIDPAGHAVGIRSGEGVYDALQPVIAALVEEFDRADA
ncbi:MAG: redoxin domain-containing protein, partial [Acidimicrobiia bacterium]|nr:redoxin domain-containing protein [Acidimicrobiia bacterium]